MTDQRSEKIFNEEADGAITGKVMSNVAWKIAHANCKKEFTHVENNKTGEKFTLFFCARHNATHAIRGIHDGYPAA